MPAWRPILVAMLLAGSAMLIADPGFGKLRKKKLELDVRKPGAVRLAGTSVAFQGLAASPQNQAVQQDLLVTLATELLANERTLTRQDNPALAEWRLQVRVNSFSMAQPQRINRGAVTTQKVQAQDNVIKWAGSMDASYQVVDRGGRVHASRNVTYRYDRDVAESGGGIPWQPSKWKIPGVKKSAAAQAVPRTPEDLKQIIIHEVVDQIAEQLGNTSDKLEVQAATGEVNLDRAVDFMEQKLWSRARDQLENMTAFPKPDQEAYRQYNLGLVYEALAYESKSATEQRANFFKAQEFYDKALEMNTRERYFVETIGRIRNGIAQYKALDNYQKEDIAKGRVAASTSTAAGTGRATTAAASGEGTPLTLAKVIEMQQAGVAEPMILEVIQASPSVVFNPVDPQTAIQVSRARLSVAVQNALRQRVGAKPLPVAGVPAPAPAKPPVSAPAKPPAPAPVKK